MHSQTATGKMFFSWHHVANEEYQHKHHHHDDSQDLKKVASDLARLAGVLHFCFSNMIHRQFYEYHRKDKS